MTPKLKNNNLEPAQMLRHLAFFALGVLSWLGFSYLFVLSIKLPRGRSIYDFPWSSDAPLWTFLSCLIGAAIIILTKWSCGLLSERSKSIFRDFVVLLCLIPVNSLLITAFSILVLKVTNSGGERPIEFDWVMGFLHEFIAQVFVAMTCIGYFYLNLVNETKEKLSAARRARAAMELKTLQQNIEPHFLFNNLNVLSALIESDPQRANDFLNRLAELYRYILRAQSAEVVPLPDELEFAENYIYLLRERFGKAYNFDLQIPDGAAAGKMIVPVALQILIENAVKHNAGSQHEPLRVAIGLTEGFVSVENDLRSKAQTKPTPKTGLQNLKTRYALLTEQPVEITENGRVFAVKLPLILQK